MNGEFFIPLPWEAQHNFGSQIFFKFLASVTVQIIKSVHKAHPPGQNKGPKEKREGGALQKISTAICVSEFRNMFKWSTI